MKLLPLLGAACVALTGGCASQGQYVNKHWSEHYVGTSMASHFLGYNPEFDGSYRDFAWRKKEAINLTIQRHLFNHNPDNPFQPVDKTVNRARPNNSLLPHPEYYIHYEGLVLGTATLAAGGVFFPLPVDSIIGTFEPGGGDEFAKGFHDTFDPMVVVVSSFLYGAVGFDGGKEQQQGQTVGTIELEGQSQGGDAQVMAEPVKN